MSAGILEAKAILSGEDKLSPLLDAILHKIETIARVGREVGRVSGSVSGAGGSIAAMGEIAQAERALGSLGSVLNRVTGDAERAARAVGDMSKATRTARQAHQEHASGRQIAMGIAGGYVAHTTAHFAHQSLETYREFDKERRFGKAVMGISDEDQGALVAQAVHLGGSTKYNDIQVLEAQRELAARGLKKDQILGMMSSAADLGQSLNLSLPDAVKQMEGAIFGFKKDISDTGAAMKSARQTADVQVRAAKISGMTPEDITDTYKYGATPARLSGVSEQVLLAFGGISKKSNMAGNEAGTAFRALMSAANAPTRGAKEALLANGLDYKNYQKKIDHIDVDPFARNVAAQYGVKLTKSAREGLAKVFSDPKVLNDPALFTPAVTKLLGSVLQGKDAKSLKSIAGMANRFRTASGGGADVNAFITDLMIKMGSGKGGIALANAIFGAKQGGRIASALGDPEVFKAMIATLRDHSEGYASKISEERMSGFDGAVSRFEGATKNLETALGRAFDANGKGGMLTAGADVAGRFMQALAEAPPQIQRLGAEAGAAAAIFAGFKGAEALMGGFGLKASAVALTGAAEALTAAASKQAIANGIPGIDGHGGGPSRLGKVLATVPIVGTAIVAGTETLSVLDEYRKNNPGKFHAHAQHAYGDDVPAPEPVAPTGHWEQKPGRNMGYTRHWVEDVKQDAAEAKTALEDVGETKVAPVVDGASLDAAIAKANQLKAALSGIGDQARGVGAAVAGIKSPMNVGTSAPGTGPAGRTPSGR